jgi:hypothetical protein
LIEFSSHVSVLPMSSRTSPPTSAQTLTPMSPLPIGIEPDTSPARLGESQTTL